MFLHYGGNTTTRYMGFKVLLEYFTCSYREVTEGRRRIGRRDTAWFRSFSVAALSLFLRILSLLSLPLALCTGQRFRLWSGLFLSPSRRPRSSKPRLLLVLSSSFFPCSALSHGGGDRSLGTCTNNKQSVGLILLNRTLHIDANKPSYMTDVSDCLDEIVSSSPCMIDISLLRLDQHMSW